MRTRAYTPADRAGCLALFDGNVPDDFRPEERPDLERFLDAPPGTYLVVEDSDGALVAAGGWAREPGTDAASLCWGMVRRDRQGEGLGRALLLARLEQVRAHPDIARVLLNTSHRVRGFYEKHGFRSERVVPDGFGPGLHRVDMSLATRSP